MPNWNLPPAFLALVAPIAWNLQARSADKLVLLLTGVLFATGRRTVAAWLRAFGVGPDFQQYYYFLSTLGRRAERIGNSLRDLVLRLVRDDWTIDLAIDDTPTERYGPCVKGCGRHRDPTPGPAGGRFLYGHVWTVAAVVAHHPEHGSIAFPLFAKLYIRRKDLGSIPPKFDWRFETKIEHAVSFIESFGRWTAFFTTDLAATAPEVLVAASDRGAIEQCFHELKEVVGAGQQQVRHVWASVGAFNLCLWSHSLVELWAWTRSLAELVDRSASPWEDSERRPSHADKRRALRRETLRMDFEQLRFAGPNRRKQKAFVEKLFAAAA